MNTANYIFSGVIAPYAHAARLDFTGRDVLRGVNFGNLRERFLRLLRLSHFHVNGTEHLESHIQVCGVPR